MQSFENFDAIKYFSDDKLELSSDDKLELSLTTVQEPFLSRSMVKPSHKNTAGKKKIKC